MSAARPVLHFAHGNSFPAGTYGALFEQLRPHYEVGALELHAHDPAFPVRSGWRELERELLKELTTRYREPVVLVGHSMGGLLCLQAAARRPELVRCVVLLDAPVVAGWRALAWQFVKLVGTDKKYSPAAVSERRRVSWPNAEAAHQYFSVRKPFSDWHPDVLRDYVSHGLLPNQHGVALRFRRETETAVYRTLPHHLGKLARRPFPVPVGFIGGRDSVECRLAGLQASRRLTGRHFRQIDGGHLFPMESPALTAAAVHDMVQDLLRSHPHSHGH